MADFYNRDQEDDQPQKIKVGEVEYTSDELSGLVADGLFKRDIETKQNTKLDKLNSAFTKLTEEKKAWETEKADFETKLKQATEPKTEENKELTPEVIAAAKAEAKKIGLYTAEDVEEYFNKKFPEAYSQQRAYDKLIDTSEGYAKDINGSDGRPAFVVEDVFAHMRETGIRDPYKAYKDLHEEALDTWKTNQLTRKGEPFVTEKSSTAGGKTPPVVRPTRENLDSLLQEAIREA